MILPAVRVGLVFLALSLTLSVELPLKPKIHQICYVIKFEGKMAQGKPQMIPCRPANFGSSNSFSIGGQVMLF